MAHLVFAQTEIEKRFELCQFFSEYSCIEKPYFHINVTNIALSNSNADPVRFLWKLLMIIEK